MLDFGQFDFGTMRLRPAGRSRNWPKSKLAEVELAELEKRAGRSRSPPGCPVEGCPRTSGGRRGVQRKGPSEMGCRVRGFGFSSGLWGRKQKRNKQNEERDE